MSTITAWTFVWAMSTFALYIGIGIWSRVRSTEGFYVAGHHVPPVLNGMATAADWMSAASFISMAGLISFMGYSGSVYLMGWTGGYVLLALLLAPYLRKFGKFTVPDFVGDRYYSNTARFVAIICAVFVSFTYVAGQMRGVGVVFSRFLQIPVEWGVVIGTALVLLYATLGGMKGVTYTQVAQYLILILAYLIPAVAISLKITGNPVPQLGLGSTVAEGPNAGLYLLDAIDKIHTDLGFAAYTAPFADARYSMINVLAITIALMVGTAGLPHVIIRFYTVPSVRGARWSAFWALLFIGILYTTAPAVATFARVNLIQTLNQKTYVEAPAWFKTWEDAGLLSWVDKDGDGKIKIAPGKVFKGSPEFTEARGASGERMVHNEMAGGPNELYVDRDIMVLANPEIAKLPAWVIGLVAAGGLAAALSTAAGLLLVISSAVSHDLLKRMVNPNMSEKQEISSARIAAFFAVLVAGYFGVNPPDFVANVVAFAFGLAASSFFPVIILGVFTKRVTKEGAIAGMITGLMFTAIYIWVFKMMAPELNKPENWWFGISPEGIGTIGMLINFAVTLTVTRFTAPPPRQVQEMVESIRLPSAK